MSTIVRQLPVTMVRLCSYFKQGKSALVGLQEELTMASFREVIYECGKLVL